MEIRRLGADELDKIRDINRTEETRVGYRQEGAELVEMAVEWDTPSWFEGNGEHSFGEMIRGAERCLELGGTAVGAIDGDRLAGIAVYRPRLTKSMGQLALLHVSSSHRKQGIASRLFGETLTMARQDGAASLYVSATPSGSAVGFYLSRGFVPTATPNPKLFAEEPEDIHMILKL